MKVAIHQPDYIPWIGYFYKMSLADVFVFLDDAQYEKNGYNNRNRIKTKNGSMWLTIPCEKPRGLQTTIAETVPIGEWSRKHVKSIENAYTKAKCFGDVFPEIKRSLELPWSSISELNIYLNTLIAGKLDIKPVFVNASSLGVETKKEQRVIDICKAVGADTYISGAGAKVYQNEEHFKEEGIELVYAEYDPIEYDQLHGGFMPYMSILDYILNNGYEDFRRKVLP